MDPLQVKSADIISQDPLINFQTEGVPPPSPLYLGQQDDLFMRVAVATIATGFQVNFAVRTLVPGGKVKVHNFPILVTGTSVTLRRNLGECFIVSITASLVGAATAVRGQVFCQASVVRGIAGGEIFFWTLLSDYVTTSYRPTWPNTILKSPLEGPGNLRSIQGTTPGAGAEVSETVPTGARWRLQGLLTNLTCSATVTNRIVGFVLDDGANNFWHPQDTVAMTASQSADFSLGPQSGVFPGAGNVARVLPMPNVPAMLAGWRLRTATAGLQGGDQFAQPKYVVEEWVEI